MKHSALPLLDYHVFDDAISNIDYQQKQLITTINQYSYCIAENDASFKKALKKSDILLPDGIGIVIAAKLLKTQKTHSIIPAYSF